MSFAKQLKKLRLENNVTQAVLGQAIGKSNRMISYYENEDTGPEMPPYEIVQAIANFFKVPMSFFETGEPVKVKFVKKLIELTQAGKIHWHSFNEWEGKNFHQADTQDIARTIDAWNKPDPVEGIVVHYFTFLNSPTLITSVKGEFYIVIGSIGSPEHGIPDAVTITSNGEADGNITKLVKLIEGDSTLWEDRTIKSMLDYLEKLEDKELPNKT